MSEHNSSSPNLPDPASWGAANVRHNKTLSQFPAAKLPSSPHGSPIPLKSRGPGAATSHGSAGPWISLNRTLPANVAILPVPHADAESPSPWSSTLEALFQNDPAAEWRGALCAVWLLADTLGDLPRDQLQEVSPARCEFNTRGELCVVRATLDASSPPPDEHAQLTLLLEYLCTAGVYLSARGDSVSTNASETTAGAEPLAPEWTSREATAHLESFADLSGWLESHVDVLPAQRKDHVRSWLRYSRRNQQNREGALMQQLGETLLRLSSPPKRSGEKRLRRSVYGAVILTLAVVAALAVFLLRK